MAFQYLHLTYSAEGYECKQEVSCLHCSGNSVWGCLYSLFQLSRHLPSQMLCLWDSGQCQGTVGHSGSLYAGQEITDTTGQLGRRWWRERERDRQRWKQRTNKTACLTWEGYLKDKTNVDDQRELKGRNQAKAAKSSGKLVWAKSVSSHGLSLKSHPVFFPLTPLILLFLSSPPGGHHELRGPAGRSGAGYGERTV